MKKTLLAILFIMINLAGFGQNLKALDDKYGFREAMFEMPVSSFKNLEFSSRDDNIYETTYKVKNADLTIGDYKFEEIKYKFYKNKLMNISITINDDLYNREGILNVLEVAYGKGVFESEAMFEKSYYWHGAKVSMFYLMANKFGDNAYLDFWCEKLFQLQAEDRKAINQKKEQKIIDASKKL